MTSYPDTYPIPQWALCYIINDDRDCVTDEEIEIIDKWRDKYNVADVSPKYNDESDFEPYFTSYPEFGKWACDVVDCYLIYRT